MEWHQFGQIFTLEQITTVTEKLNSGVYTLGYMEQKDKYYLTKISDAFTQSYKIYDLDTPFINRVIKSWNATNTNMGILLYGMKGTGKSVTAKMICNKMNLPVIVITKRFKGAELFLNSIKQDIVVLIDEYEKIYERDDSRDSDSLLSLMDGVFDSKTGSRKMFILTSNNKYINENMNERPSRIRYKKKYENILISHVHEIIDDNLNHPARRDALIKYISKLQIITVDIVKSLISEVNIHDEDPESFVDVFNTCTAPVLYNIGSINDNKETILEYATTIKGMMPDGVPNEMLGNTLRTDECHYGRISKIVNKTTVLVDSTTRNGEAITKTYKITPVGSPLHKIFN